MGSSRLNGGGGIYYLKHSQIVYILGYTHAQQIHTYTLYISTYKVTRKVCVADRESAPFLLYRLRNISRKGKKEKLKLKVYAKCL